MIPDYKLYHGAVLAELVHELTEPVSIDELSEEGRLSSYILNGSIGVHIKHSAQRLHPWQFTFTKQNLIELGQLRSRYSAVFIILVCCTDGMVCINLDEAASLLKIGDSEQAWLRVDRRRRKWYEVTGSGGDLGSKLPSGLDSLVRAIQASEQADRFIHELQPASTQPEQQTSKPSLFSFAWPGSRR